jgi:hypothetical protein
MRRLLLFSLGLTQSVGEVPTAGTEGRGRFPAHAIPDERQVEHNRVQGQSRWYRAKHSGAWPDCENLGCYDQLTSEEDDEGIELLWRSSEPLAGPNPFTGVEAASGAEQKSVKMELHQSTTSEFEFGAAVFWLMSTFHRSQMGMVLVFASDRSLRLPSWILPCGKRLVSPIDRVCFYVVDDRDLEQGLVGFDLLTDDLHSSYVAALMLCDLEQLSASGIEWDALLDVLPSFTRILLSDVAQHALPQLSNERLSAVSKRAGSVPWVMCSVGSMKPGLYVEMQIAPAAGPLSSADYVRGVCEARFNEGDAIGSLLVCVAVWGYMQPNTAILQCVEVSARLLAFTYTLPFGMSALGCVILDAEIRQLELTQEVAEQYVPGFGLPPGSSATLTFVMGLPLLALGVSKDYVRGVDGMRLSVEGSTVAAALRWSGFQQGTWHRKVTWQKETLASYLPPSEGADFRILEVGCGGLTIGGWLIDTLSPFSYACVDVAPWAARLIIKYGLRVDVADGATFSSMDRSFWGKHPLIEGNSECKVRALDRGRFNVVFSFTMLAYLSCNMLFICLDSMAEALQPAGKILVSIPVPATTLVSNARSRQFVLNYPHPDPCDTRDGTRQWAQSHRFVVTVIAGKSPASRPSSESQEIWLLEAASVTPAPGMVANDQEILVHAQPRQ